MSEKNPDSIEAFKVAEEMVDRGAWVYPSCAIDHLLAAGYTIISPSGVKLESPEPYDISWIEED